MAATVHTKLTASDQTSAAFKSIGGNLNRLGNNITATAAKVAKIGVAFATAGAAAAAALTKASMANIDEMAKIADRIGMTTESLAGLQHAASLAGVENKTLEKSLQNLTIGISNAADGTGLAKDALLELGLNAKALEQLPVDQQMNAVADAMQGVKNQTDKVRIAYELFGARGVKVLNMLGDGSAGLSEMAKEAEHLGISISRVDAAQIEQANDAVTRASGVFTGLGNQLATAFSPLITKVADSFRQAALDTVDFGDIGQKVVNTLVTTYGKLADGIFYLRLGFKMLSVKMLEVAKVIVDKLDPVFTWLAEKYNNIAKVLGLDLIDTGKFAKISENLAGAAELGMAQVREMMAQPLPSEGIQATYDAIVEETRRVAETIAEEAPGKVIAESFEDGVDTAVKSLGFLDQQAEEGAKKLTEFMNKNATERTEHVVGELNNMFGAVAGNNKKLFAANKAFQIAQAIMDTYRGATLAMSSYPPPINFAMAAATVAAGMANVQQIRAQSFLGGGFTGNGSRSGGLDSKGGKLAMVHSNEYILDTKKPGGMPGGITINNNVDARGSDETRVRAAIEKASRETIMSIQDLMARGRFA